MNRTERLRQKSRLNTGKRRWEGKRREERGRQGGKKEDGRESGGGTRKTDRPDMFGEMEGTKITH